MLCYTCFSIGSSCVYTVKEYIITVYIVEQCIAKMFLFGLELDQIDLCIVNVYMLLLHAYIRLTVNTLKSIHKK